MDFISYVYFIDLSSTRHQDKAIEEDCIPEVFKSMDESKFIYGWIMFYPFIRFFSKSKMNAEILQHHDSYVWLLYMAATYQTTGFEKNMTFF